MVLMFSEHPPPEDTEKGQLVSAEWRESETEGEGSLSKEQKTQPEGEVLLDVSQKSVPDQTLGDVGARLWADGLPNLVYAQGFSLMSIGYLWVSTGR